MKNRWVVLAVVVMFVLLMVGGSLAYVLNVPQGAGGGEHTVKTPAPDLPAL